VRYPDDAHPQPQPADALRMRPPLATLFLVAAAGMVALAISVAPRSSLAQSDLQLVFADDGTSGSWQDRWFLDGPANVDYTADGMVFDASPGSGEAVLWAKPVVRGDVRIEYDYTHIDDASNPYVVIIFIQAQGTGSRAADISTWERPVASYPIYHGEMSNYSITYDNAANTVRARHNPGQAAAGEFKYEGMFERDETYHITIEKSGLEFSMTATNDRTGASRTFDFTGSASKAAIDEGRIGLRHMDDRSSRYRNFRIWASEYVGGGGNVAGGSGSGGGSG
jgi:hypothetical protein